MKIVVDTNVVVSGVFFGGNPRKVLEAVYNGKIEACASDEIITEYNSVVERMIRKKSGALRNDVLQPFISKLTPINVTSQIALCRDPDDNKFLSCAIDADAMFIVSGDNDLLSLKEYENIRIVTAADFCRLYL